MVDVLVRNVMTKLMAVWKGIMGVIPKNVPMAVPQARDCGSPWRRVNLR